MSKRTALYAVLCLLTIFSTTLSAKVGSQVRQLVKFQFSEYSQNPVMPWCFCVTEDGIYIIPDQGAGNIKLYEENGEQLTLIDSFGRYGLSRGELQMPSACFYNKVEGRFGVLDIGRTKILVYDRIGRTDFELFDEFYCPSGGYDIALFKDILMVSGYRENSTKLAYDLYCQDIRTGKVNFLLKSSDKYGVKATENYDQNPEFRAIGIKGFFSMSDDGKSAYYQWEGNLLRLLRIDIKDQKVNTITLERSQKSGYTLPKADDNLISQYQNRDIKATEEARNKLFFVRRIYRKSGNIISLFQGPNPKGILKSWLLIYNEKKKTQEEVLIPGPVDKFRYSFNKEQNLLYTLIPINSGRSGFEILRYRISIPGF